MRTDLRSFLLGHLPSMPSLTFADDPGDTRRVGLPGSRYARAALGWLPRFIDERLPQLTEVALAASALAELRHGSGTVGVEVLKFLLRRGSVLAQRHCSTHCATLA